MKRGNMKQLTPVDVKGDSWEIFEALNEMFVRAAQMARKRPSPIDIEIGTASISVIVALEDYFHEKGDAKAAIERLNRTFQPIKKLRSHLEEAKKDFIVTNSKVFLV